MSKLKIIPPGPLVVQGTEVDTSALHKAPPLPSKTRKRSESPQTYLERHIRERERDTRRRHASEMKGHRPGGVTSLLSIEDLTPVFGYAALGVLALYAYKSYTEGGVDVDGTGQKRNIFRWVDAACGALIGVALFRFARTMY